MKANRRDANESEIVAALRAVGADVVPVERMPFDLVCGYRHQSYLLEVKQPKGKLKPSQVAFRQSWRGHYAIVRSADEALIAIGAIQSVRVAKGRVNA
ncbi:MAG: hypothetical protein KGL39_43105 [Patescibacteria group bacterium]|nr:hypothetical protein [Patescibacteria group bacterium]